MTIQPVTLGPRGESIIKSRETLRLTAYKPTPNDVWTIGYGHTLGVKSGQTCTREQAEKWFLEDVNRIAIPPLIRLSVRMESKGLTLTQSMIDALISLIYNGGEGVILSGTTIGDALLSGSPDMYYRAWRGFALWTKQRNSTPQTNDDDLLGLARRRSEEMVLFLADGIPKRS